MREIRGMMASKGQPVTRPALTIRNQKSISTLILLDRFLSRIRTTIKTKRSIGPPFCFKPTRLRERRVCCFYEALE